ncbi:mycothiol transferase [Nonomuraea aridisoli]|uniref:DUF664 domain-containing protein n=1 Tax=Nonomuraea aridisoli TaxID=2070368 RepID=A0A2W2D775_9ACTN|nr:DUF664 domain-containing protein [Nonomuraea aridisoli]PZG07856.1 hypothetical protein C1J01_39915 [Nonomuraea aridisoli]
MTVDQATPTERADLLAVPANQRRLLRHTARDLTDEQAARRTTVSELCLGGLIKHVTASERNWAGFLQNGPSAMADVDAMTEADLAAWADTFRMLPGESLAGILADYADVARRTDELIATLPDLDAAQPLPRTPSSSASPWTAPRPSADH